MSWAKWPWAVRIKAWLSRCVRTARNSRARLGAEGEHLAAGFLASRGYRVVDRNVRVPMGEADIIAIDPDGQTWVLVEVKTRTREEGQHPRSAAATPEENVTATKQATLRQILAHLRRANRWQSARIDVVAVEMVRSQAVVRHHVAAVETSGTGRGA